MAAVNASLPGQIDYKPAFGLPQDFQTHPGPAPYTQQYTGQDTFPVGPPMNEAYPTIPFAINPSALRNFLKILFYQNFNFFIKSTIV